jgi:hypothetical protein
VLTFDAATHRYGIDGKPVPSVTQVLSMLDNWENVPRDVLEAARDFGRKVHSACALHNSGELDTESLDPLLLPYLDAWRKFLEESNVTLVASETRVMHHGFGYAGTFDALLERRGHRWLIDIKSGAVPVTVGPQLAAYAQALGSKVRRYSVQLRADGTYRCEPYTSSTDWSIFLSCLNVWKWREKHQ